MAAALASDGMLQIILLTAAELLATQNPDFMGERCCRVSCAALARLLSTATRVPAWPGLGLALALGRLSCCCSFSWHVTCICSETIGVLHSRMLLYMLCCSYSHLMTCRSNSCVMPGTKP